MNKKIFSVVIVSYKKLDILIECIESIYKFNDIGELLEIIIVDNSPEKDIYNYLIEKYPEIVIIKNENKGFGQANNIGACRASGEYLLFLNPDTILIEPIFKFAINKFKNNGDLALFGLKLLNRELKQNYSFNYIDKFGIISNQLMKINNKFNRFIDGKMYIIGADIFIRKEIFYECGMFDEKIFMFSEEPDLVRRVKTKCKINDTAFFHEKRIIHLEGRSNQTWDEYKNSLEYLINSKIYYCKKYNLDAKKELRKLKKYEYFKLFMYILMFKRNIAYKQYEVCQIYKNLIKGDNIE